MVRNEFFRESVKKLRSLFTVSNIVQLFIIIAVLWGVQIWQTRGHLSGSTAPGFTLHDIEGRVHNLSDYRGKKVVLYFFAPWCSVCSISSINVNRFYEDNRNGDTVIIAVATAYRQQSEVEEFVKEHRLKLPVLLDNGTVRALYKVDGFPTFYFIDQDSRVDGSTVGFTTKTGLWFRAL